MIPQVVSRVKLAIQRNGEEIKSWGAADVFMWWRFMTTDVIRVLTCGNSFRMLEVSHVSVSSWINCTDCHWSSLNRQVSIPETCNELLGWELCVCLSHCSSISAGFYQYQRSKEHWSMIWTCSTTPSYHCSAIRNSFWRIPILHRMLFLEICSRQKRRQASLQRDPWRGGIFSRCWNCHNGNLTHIPHMVCLPPARNSSQVSASLVISTNGFHGCPLERSAASESYHGWNLAAILCSPDYST